MTSGEFIYGIFNADRYVCMNMEKSETCEAIVAHARTQGSFDSLESAEGPFSSARSNRESAKNCDKSLDVREEA